MKKRISLLLLFIMILALNTTALASNVSVNPADFTNLEQPGRSTSTVVLTADAVQFSVIVPTKLPLHIGSDGGVTTATNAKFINRSYAPVRVSQAEIKATEGWTLAPYERNIKEMDLASQEVGFKIHGVATLSKGSKEVLLFDKDKIQIQGRDPGASENTTFSLNYKAVVPVQTKSIANEKKIADVVFTIGWDM